MWLFDKDELGFFRCKQEMGGFLRTAFFLWFLHGQPGLGKMDGFSLSAERWRVERRAARKKKAHRKSFLNE